MVRPTKRLRLRLRLLASILFSTTTLMTALLVACGPGFMDGLVGGGKGTGGGPGTSDGGDGGDPFSCAPAKIPDPPTQGGSSDSLDVYFAFEGIRVDTVDNDAGGIPAAQGFDLDGLCTCPQPRACTRAEAGSQCDGVNGRDNALGTMINALNDYIPQFEQSFATTRIVKGQYTILVHLERWNGEANDPDVIVTIFGSQNLDSSADGGSDKKDPAFDGNDVWTIDPRTIGTGEIGADCRLTDSLCTFLPSRVARGLDGKAWVKDGTLVAKFGSAPLFLRTALAEMIFDLDDLTLVAKLGEGVIPGGGASIRRLDGELIGAWPVGRALSAVANLESPFDLQRLCKSDGGLFYNEAKRSLCAAIDLPSKIGDPSSSACGKMSAAISFRASAAKAPSVIYTRNEPAGDCVDYADDCK